MNMQTPPRSGSQGGPPPGHRYPPPPPGANQGSGGPAVNGRIATSSAGTRPSAYWPLSIIAILCSLLLGGIGLYFSSQVQTRWDNGDTEGARKASKTALILDLIGIGIGIVVLVAAASGGSTY
jgi:hypothetical protein